MASGTAWAVGWDGWGTPGPCQHEWVDDGVFSLTQGPRRRPRDCSVHTEFEDLSLP